MIAQVHQMTDNGSGSPQIENGYTRLANELLDALARIRIPGEAQQVLYAIIRKTYGWGKKVDHISLSQLSEATGLSRSAVQRARDKLTKLNVVYSKKSTPRRVTYQLNKHYGTWKPYSKKSTSPQVYSKKSTGGPLKRVHRCTPKRVPQKKHSKETIQKKEDSRHREAVEYWHNRYLDKIGFKYDFSARDGKHIKDLLKVFSFEQFKALVDYMLTTDDPWIADGRRTLGILYSLRNMIVQRLKNPKGTITDKRSRQILEMHEYLQRRKETNGPGERGQISQDTV